ncbi:WGR domain-containing protein [candidate division CSSED10-310 bacterium]|uniref:WGR domain-containing protein n=1 Tax=candidate division CSSED10-310 bacterium TaxID=2855610 RepID=A0ABV6YS54_UNCC1
MKLLRQLSLFYQKGKSDKVYEVDLCEVGADQYVVNFRYGRRGTNLKDGSKTVLPVRLEQAERIFDDLVSSKKKKGYWESQEKPAEPVVERVVSPVTPGAGQQKTILVQLEAALKATGSGRGVSRSVERLLWRVGELRLTEALPLLLRAPTYLSDRYKYCLTWALGRLGDEQALARLEKMISDRKQAVYLTRMAMEAYRACARGNNYEHFINEVLARLPEQIADLTRNGPEPELDKALTEYLHSADQAAYTILDDLYLIDNEHVRPVLLKFIRTTPLKPPYFRHFRRMFKAAEFRFDAEVFGILAYRFEREKSNFFRSSYAYGSLYMGGQWVNIAKELKQPNARIAYSNKTRDYFRRRVWRFLKRLGEQQGDEYVQMAVGVLLPFKDGDAVEPRVTEVYDWRARGYIITAEYDRFARYFAFNHILYGRSPRYESLPQKLLWKCARDHHPGAMPPPQREESFPELWDRQPQGLLDVLAGSECEVVHEFAVKALQTRAEFCRGLETDVLVMLLSRPYAATNRFGLELAAQRYDPAAPDFFLVLGLLCSSLPEARTLARSWIDQNRPLFLKNTEFLVALVANPFAEIRKFARELLQGAFLSPSDMNLIVDQLISEILSIQDEDLSDLISDVGETMMVVFTAVLRQLSFDVIRQLLAHPLPGAHVFAGNVLLNHQKKPQELPAEFISILINSDDARARGCGLRLFGEMPLEFLLQKKQIVLNFCLSALPDIRQSIKPVVKKLADSDAKFGESLAQTLTAALLRQEEHEGSHNDVVTMLQESLTVSLKCLSRETMSRLMKARSLVVKEFGGFLLRNFYTADDFSIREIFRFACHEIRAVREFAWYMCQVSQPRIKLEMGEIVQILDSSWPDTREFAFVFLKENFTSQDYTPKILVAICDSVQTDVQRFGCELISRYFEDEAGREYLVKLSQHPSSTLQLFVTNYLERYAADSAARLLELFDYFLIVLSQINRARLAKSRILLFLQKESLKSRESAEIIAELMSRLSVTTAIGDRSTYIEVMRDIRLKYPDIELSLTVKPVAEWKGSSHAF